MGRSRASAKAAGSGFERQVADTLHDHVSEFIDRRVKTGAADKGDISNVRTQGGQKVVVEVKNVKAMALSSWVTEAETERVNDQAQVGVVFHKRHGKGDPLDCYVTMTGRDFITLLTEKRPS